MKNCYTPNIIDAYNLIARAYLKLSDYTNALNYIFQSIKKYIPSSETCCILAEIFEKYGNQNQAILWYNFALVVPLSSLGFVQRDYEEFIPYIELSRLYYSINYDRAKEYYKKAKIIKPNSEIIKFNEKFFTH